MIDSSNRLVNRADFQLRRSGVTNDLGNVAGSREAAQSVGKLLTLDVSSRRSDDGLNEHARGAMIERAFDIVGNAPGFQLMKSNIYAVIGDYSTAITSCKSALRLLPTDQYIMARLSGLHLKKGGGTDWVIGIAYLICVRLSRIKGKFAAN